jgi:predicted component of type VI protein secretion system
MSASDATPVLEGGWALQGTDGKGDRIRLVFGETELAQAYLGLAVGRHPALCERTLADESVSRRHFRIGLADARLYVEDLNSLNGTFLDGERIAPFEPVPLALGQVIVAGRTTLTVFRLADR